jgi:hypothetical protein
MKKEDAKEVVLEVEKPLAQVPEVDQAKELHKAKAQVPKEKMCTLPVTKLKVACDWLNSDNMTMPQNEVRQVLALLMSAKVI